MHGLSGWKGTPRMLKKVGTRKKKKRGTGGLYICGVFRPDQSEFAFLIRPASPRSPSFNLTMLLPSTNALCNCWRCLQPGRVLRPVSRRVLAITPFSQTATLRECTRSNLPYGEPSHLAATPPRTLHEANRTLCQLSVST
jgi:hypothetical protein